MNILPGSNCADTSIKTISCSAECTGYIEENLIFSYKHKDGDTLQPHKQSYMTLLKTFLLLGNKVEIRNREVMLLAEFNARWSTATKQSPS